MHSAIIPAQPPTAKMSRYISFAVILFVIAIGSSADQPSLKFFVQQRGIAEIQNIVNSELIDVMDKVEIPDQHYSSLGIHLDLTNIRLRDFNFSEETLQYSPPSDFIVNINNLVCTCYMNWSYVLIAIIEN